MIDFLKRLCLAAFAAGLCAGTALAQEPQAAGPPSLLDNAINQVRVSYWQVSGTNQTHALIDSDVQGGRALRVDVPSAGAASWEVSAIARTIRPVAVGDKLVLAVWLRAERVPEGSKGRVNLRLQGSAAPYPRLAGETVELNETWKLAYATGVSQEAFESGRVTANVQMASQSQTIDVGPVFILNMGPDFDLSTIPTD